MARDITRGDAPGLVLAVLAEGASHGYAIARSIEQRSGQTFQMKEGTLYPILRLLEQQGLVTGEWELQPTGPARKVYHITESGLLELNKRQLEWQQFAQTMFALLGGRPDVQPS